MVFRVVGIEDHQCSFPGRTSAHLREDAGVEGAPGERIDALHEYRNGLRSVESIVNVDREHASRRVDLLQDHRPHDRAPTAIATAFDDQVRAYFADDLLRDPRVERMLEGRNAEPPVCEKGRFLLVPPEFGEPSDD